MCEARSGQQVAQLRVS